MTVATASANRPKPHILVLGQVDDNIREYLDTLGTGVHMAENMMDVRERDYDFILSLNRRTRLTLSGNASVLHFSSLNFRGEVATIGEPIGYSLGSNARTNYEYEILRGPGGKAAEFEFRILPDALHNYQDIIKKTIGDNVSRAGDYSVVSVRGKESYRVLPLMNERDGSALAAIIELPGYKKFWTLPGETTDPVRWIKFFLDVMKRNQPDAFPSDQVGLADDWRTPDELDAIAAVAQHKAETERIVQERQLLLGVLEQQSADATEMAEAGDRMLLTSQGDPLVNRVADVLRVFGFEVEDRDEHAAATQSSKKEDLRITYPDYGGTGWICLAEVKGFIKGAKANVILQVQKVAGIFEGQNGRPPTAQWYVVNHHLGDPAQTRPEPLKSNPDEVADFAADGGLVIDTRWLFQLKKRVDMGTMTPEEAAESLIVQTGMFTLPETIVTI